METVSLSKQLSSSNLKTKPGESILKSKIEKTKKQEEC